MKSIVHELSRLNWSDPGWQKLAADILCDSDSLAEVVAQYMRSWDPGVRKNLIHASHETASHYKWLIHRNEAPIFTVWLHDYKPASGRGQGYAQVPHNHRYDLCSIVLAGGYDSVWYEVSDEIAPIKRQTIVPGDVLSMTHDEVHSLTNIHDGTQSLFVEGPIKKNFSTSYPSGGDAQNWVDFHGRWAPTLARLSEARK
jgi:hypothetical protein